MNGVNRFKTAVNGVNATDRRDARYGRGEKAVNDVNRFNRAVNGVNATDRRDARYGRGE